jgi:hypothetical protein
MPPHLGEMLEEFLCGCGNLWAGCPNIIGRQSIYKGWPLSYEDLPLWAGHMFWTKTSSNPTAAWHCQSEWWRQEKLRLIHNLPGSNE